MKTMIAKTGWSFMVGIAMAVLVSCGGSGGGSSGADEGTVVGTLQLENRSTSQIQATQSSSEFVILDESSSSTALEPDGAFEVSDVADGDHSLFVHLHDGTIAEIPFRMLNHQYLDLGQVHVRNGWVISHTGFDGYRFGFVDENGDGINDNFTDSNGDGICDNGYYYAGSPYMLGLGFVDQDGDGINDNFIDEDGDGICDRTGAHSGNGFGFVDMDGDGINDNFVDANGDGICDLTGMPFSHPFGYIDIDGDGINDNFSDANGDGICDHDRNYGGVPYMATPGWLDENSDGFNDLFADANGDGFNDLTGTSYAHGYGWGDVDRDRINDRIRDRDGDCVADCDDCLFAQKRFGYGYQKSHPDRDGNGIDDVTQLPFSHGFGWADTDADQYNDRFQDENGDGINDLNGAGYTYRHGYKNRRPSETLQ